ncbi:hypothetical protein BGZ99_002718 [Dissophora globulifera]|uniref:Uncharacterized protein n=1 Tax=Dissophora globulifera TaxID=979702 RepID=A0A9P6RMF1_9FUNG|nr:hypothetical protein BGZ99_002718 [Dissophora globulifera]
MLSGRSAAEKAERRAAKAQSLYVATPSSLTSSGATHSSFLPHTLHAGQLGQPSFSSNTFTGNSNHNNGNSSSTPKSPRKSRPFSMLFLHPHEEQAGHPTEQHSQQQQQQQQHALNESDEDALVDGQSLSSTAIDYGESDLKEADSDTRMLITHLTELDDLISFLKKRSTMEFEYGTNLMKLATGLRDSYRQQSQEAIHQAHCKQGSYGDAWSNIMGMHERLGNNRLELSRDLQVISEELLTIYKETDRSRKQFKEAGAKQERIVQEHEQNLEKAKQKYDSLTEEWERAILQKAADPSTAKKTMTKGMSIFRQPKSVVQLNKQEEEARAKATVAHDQYKAQLAKTNDTRQYYFSQTLPSMLKNLKDTIDESDLSLQYYLVRYGYMCEDYTMKDAVILNPINGSDLGLRDQVEMINKDTDLQVFIQAYSAKASTVVKAAAPYQEYLMSAQAQSIINPKPIFGCDLADQLIRDETDLPEIVVKCTEAIERFGMDIKGIYRVSGIKSDTSKLRSAFDRDCAAVDLSTEEICGDINNVTGVLKSWFRELPEPLLTRKLYPEFIKAASIEDPELQLMNLHHVTNQLPDPNYATLKYLMCHLNRVQANQAINLMGPSNLGLIFGPTLTSTSSDTDAVHDLADMGLQCTVVETLLRNYGAIFDFDEDEEDQEGEEGMQHSVGDFEGSGQNDIQQGRDFEDHQLQQQKQQFVQGQEQQAHMHQGAVQYDEYGIPYSRKNAYEEDYGDRMVPVAEEAEDEGGEDAFIPQQRGPMGIGGAPVSGLTNIPGGGGVALGGVTPVITAGGAAVTAGGGVGGVGMGAKGSNLSGLQEIEEAYNKRLDADVAQLLESFGDIVKVASIAYNESSISKDKYKLAQESYQIQGRATNIVSSAESLLAMVTELKQTLLLNDANTLAQLSTQRQADLSNQKTAVKQRVLGLKEEVDRTIWELEEACYGSTPLPR